MKESRPFARTAGSFSFYWGQVRRKHLTVLANIIIVSYT